MGYSPWGRKESDTTEWLSMYARSLPWLASTILGGYYLCTILFLYKMHHSKSLVLIFLIKKVIHNKYRKVGNREENEEK